jgi:pseudouridine synthase, RluA family
LTSRLSLTRSFIQQQIKQGAAWVNGKMRKANDSVQQGDKIVFRWPVLQEYDLVPENIPLDVIYQDADMAVVNKPKDMVVHPSAGHQTGTLVHALLYHMNDLAGVGGVLRPGIVHRIDKDTSGLLVIAKNDAAHQALADQMKTKQAGRIYVAVIQGYLPESPLRIDEPIGRSMRDRKKMAAVSNGRPAATCVSTLETYTGYSLVKCELETGRTHQIRVHMKYIKHPIVGDQTYSYKKTMDTQGQLLHAYKLQFIHPTSGKTIVVEAEMPKVFKDVLDELRKE